MEQIHILLVEDNKYASQGMRLNLIGAGYKVTPARKASEALALARQTRAKGGKVDLLLAEATLPDMAGLELLETLRSEGFDSQMVMLDSGYGSPRLLELAKGKCADLIDNPFNPFELLSRVANVVTGRFKGKGAMV